MAPAKVTTRLAWTLASWSRSLCVAQLVTYPGKLLVRALPGNEIPSRYRLVTFTEAI